MMTHSLLHATLSRVYSDASPWWHRMIDFHHVPPYPHFYRFMIYNKSLLLGFRLLYIGVKIQPQHTIYSNYQYMITYICNAEGKCYTLLKFQFIINWSWYGHLTLITYIHFRA